MTTKISREVWHTQPLSAKIQLKTADSREVVGRKGLTITEILGFITPAGLCSGRTGSGDRHLPWAVLT